MRASGAVLAGGQSRRMGTDKALLTVDSVTLLDRTVTVLSEVVDSVFVVGGGHETPEPARYVEDLFPGEGPVGGLISALAAAETEALIVTSCDLPSLTADIVSQVVDALRVSGADYVVPLANGRRQWHCVGFRRRCHGPLELAFNEGARSYRHALDALSECALVLPRPADLVDVDTPEQYARFRDTGAVDPGR